MTWPFLCQSNTSVCLAVTIDYGCNLFDLLHNLFIVFVFFFQGLFHKTLQTSGTLFCSAGWATNQEGESTAPPDTALTDAQYLKTALAPVDPISALGLQNALDKDKLAAWCRDQSSKEASSHDPGLSMLIKLSLKDDDVQSSVPVGRCHLTSTDPELEFCTDEDLENDPRFRLLRLRHYGVGQFKNLTFIPPTISSSNQNQPVVKTALALLKEHDRRRGKDATTVADGLGRAAAHAKRLKIARESISEWIRKAMETTQGRKSWEDVVYEESMPDIGVMGGKLLQPFGPRRPLKPAPVDRRPLNIDSHPMLGPSEIQLVVSISQAIGLPTRLSEDSLCSPFVEVSFQEVKVRSSCGRGSSPSWNEVLTLPMRAPKATDEITLNIFDEASVDILQDSRERGTIVHKRMEKLWLGSLKVRVSALLAEPRLEGTFRLNTPPVLLGYYWADEVPRSQAQVSYMFSSFPVFQLHACLHGVNPQNPCIYQFRK